MDDLDFNNLNESNSVDNDVQANKVQANGLKGDDGQESCQGGQDSYRDDCEDNSDSLKTSTFYTESYKKPSSRKNSSLMQIVIVALVSSILGGAVVGSFFQFVAPSLQPSVKSYFDKMIPGNKVADASAQQKDNGIYKRVEIVQNADSPVTAIAEKVGPSIVGIRVTPKDQPNDFSFFFSSQQPQTAEGSGIIIRSNGYIMTNNHVIEGAFDQAKKFIEGSKIEVFLSTNKDKPYSAQVIGRDEKTDLAVIKIDAAGLPAAEFGNSDTLKIGELAVAIGNPGGLEYMGSVTVGVISGLNRTVPVGDGKELKLVQTDAAINPGNSGGALVNSKGQIIGINTIKIVQTGFEGLGFAIPINNAKTITDSLIEFKYVKGRPFLGISADTRFDAAMAKQYKVPEGILVADVTPLSGAQKGGIVAGDIITKFDSKPVKNIDELNTIKNTHKAGDTIAVELYRDGETKTVQVKLTEDKGTLN